MYRTHTCGELRLSHVGQTVTLAGWVQKSRRMGGMSFVDIRDRYGITQLRVDDSTDPKVSQTVASLGREFVIQATGVVEERQNKNTRIPTGEIEIRLTDLKVLNASLTPPFTVCGSLWSGERELLSSVIGLCPGFYTCVFRLSSTFLKKSQKISGNRT